MSDNAVSDVLAIDQQLFRAAVADAVRAPSMYNEQPWRFRLVDGRIDVRLDPDRRLTAADPTGWAARIACGAAITNIRLRLAVSGRSCVVRILPLGPDDPLIASITVLGSHTPTPTDHELCSAIPLRHSNRRPFTNSPVPLGIRARLDNLIETAGGWLALVDDRVAVARIAELIASADATLRSNDRYLAEMATWAARDADAPIGIPVGSAGVAPATQDLLTMRDYGGPQRPPGRDFETDPLVAVLGTIDDRPDDDVNGGMMLQTLLLAATAERLSTSMLSQPIEVPALRDQLARVARGSSGAPRAGSGARIGSDPQTGRRLGAAQMVVRIGYGYPTTPSRRRPIDDVIDGPAS
ncbi:MAG TPA: nitroreductase [Micromonosporaceae bacterium]